MTSGNLQFEYNLVLMALPPLHLICVCFNKVLFCHNCVQKILLDDTYIPELLDIYVQVILN